MLNPKDFQVNLANRIGKTLKEQDQTIAVAESVTAGQLQVALSLADKAMEFFQGGITAYNLGQKSKHLGIDPIHAMCTDCVSQQIASGMAVHVSRLFNCNWGIGITGYASTVPEKNIEELFACFAISRDGEVVECETINAEIKEPLEVRQFYTTYVLEHLLKLIETDA
jgi:PncC family amidohydrolase